MRVALAADHAGWPLRARLVQELSALAHELVDCGSPTLEPGDDYPDRSAAVSRAVIAGRAERGVVLCGSGVGAAVAANKIHGIRACMCHDSFSARQGVEDDDMNVLCLGARVIGEDLAVDLLRDFLGAQFSGEERHRRRLNKVIALERGGV